MTAIGWVRVGDGVMLGVRVSVGVGESVKVGEDVKVEGSARVGVSSPTPISGNEVVNSGVLDGINMCFDIRLKSKPAIKASAPTSGITTNGTSQITNRGTGDVENEPFAG